MAVIFKVEGEINDVKSHPYGSVLIFFRSESGGHKIELFPGKNLELFEKFKAKSRTKVTNIDDLMPLIKEEYKGKKATFVIEN